MEKRNKLIESSSLHHKKKRQNRCLECSTSPPPNSLSLFVYLCSSTQLFTTRTEHIKRLCFGNFSGLINKEERTKTIRENTTKRKESRQITCDENRILHGNAQMCNQITIKTHYNSQSKWKTTHKIYEFQYTVLTVNSNRFFLWSHCIA